MKYIFVFCFLSLFIFNSIGQESSTCVYANYDSRFGDSYGASSVGDGLYFGISFGGILMNKVENSIQETTGVPTEKQKSLNWNMFFSYVFSKSYQGFYTGLSYTHIKYQGSFMYPEPFENSGGLLKYGSIDPIFGYVYAKQNGFYIDGRIGYGIAVLKKEEMTVGGETHDLDYWADYLNDFNPSGEELPNIETNILEGIFFSINVGYAF